MLAVKREVLAEVLVRVEGIGDADGTPMPEAVQRDVVLDMLPLLNATFDAFLTEYQAAPGKISKPSPRR